MNIAILGFGIVGQGVYRIIHEQQENQNPLFQNLAVKKILVRNKGKQRKTKVPPELLCDDFHGIQIDSDIDLVIEVTSDQLKAAEYMAKALQAGKHVVTANKAALADHFKILQHEAIANHRHLLFEASVAGGIPIISALQTLRGFDKINRLQGIINSSTNYLLTETCKGRPLDEVEREARELGVLEENAAADLLGFDAIRKLRIMSMMLLRQEIPADEVPGFGITQVDDRDSQLLDQFGYQIKLLAELLNGEKAGLKKDEIALSVFPTALRHNKFNHIDGLFNEVALEGDYCGELRFSGYGGTMFPTASAVVSDMLRVNNSEPQFYPLTRHEFIHAAKTLSSVFYLRLIRHSQTEETVRQNLQNLASSVLVDSDNEFAILSKPISYGEACDLYKAGVHVIRVATDEG